MDAGKDIDRKAVLQRNEYIKRKKESGKITKGKIGEKKRGKCSKDYKQLDVKASSAVYRKSSFLGLQASLKSSKSESKVLGKSKVSAIKKRNNKKSLAKYAGSVGKKTVGNVAQLAQMAKQQIKNIAIQNKIQDIANSKEPSDMLSMIGEKGVHGAVKLSGLVVRFIFKVIVNVLKLAVSCLGSYIFIAIAALALIFVVITAGEIQNDYSITSLNADTAATTSSVRTPRIAGTSMELTYRDVYYSKWYSSHIAEDGTRFSGDNGLDKWRGDRGGNCTAYAWGRRCELEGQRTQLGANGDAYFWYARELAAGVYKCGQTAKVGAVCCWSYGYSSNGHVAVIEQINADGTIVTSNSAYGSTTGIPKLFYNDVFADEEDLKNAYGIFQGYIYLEKKR